MKLRAAKMHPKVQVHDSFKHLSHHWLPEEGLHVELEHEQQAGHDQSVET